MSVEGQVGRPEREAHEFRLAGRERDLTEGFELADGAGHAGGAVVNVNLHDLFGCSRSAVGDAGAYCNLAAHRQGRGAQSGIAVLDPAVGEPVAERIEGAVGDAAIMRLVWLERSGAVGPSRGLVRVIVRLLARPARKARGEPARGTVGAEQDVGD